jgi:flagellin
LSGFPRFINDLESRHVSTICPPLWIFLWSKAMVSTINTNLNSLQAQLNLTMNQASLSTSMQRLSSGLRINSAKDDAAGLAIADRMTSQINGLDQAGRNANDGISLSQTAEGGLGSITNDLQRIRSLAVQSANSTNSASDRASLQQEVSQLQSEINRVATQTQFNGINLLDGTFTAAQFQVGANAGQTITVGQINSAKVSDLGAYQGYNSNTVLIGTASTATGPASITIPTSPATVYQLGTISNDAKAIANAATAAGIPGMTITANATTALGQTQAIAVGASTGIATIVINGATINLQETLDASSNRAAAVTAINAQSASTGVVATDTGSTLTLTAADGRNITTSGFNAGTTGATEADWGLATAGVTTGASLNVNYVAPTGVAGTLTIDGPGGAPSLVSAAVTTTGTAVGSIDISTVQGANAALSSIDAAIASVDSSRSALGAIQNRFTQTVSNLATSGLNLTAARSRIQDADFAAETANLSRAQILQQAGTAMVAQANQLPQQVLQLLR